jgi:Uma2 family endonuclease
MMIPEPVMTRTGMSMDDFIAQYDTQPFELIDGERRILMPTVLGHNVVMMLLYDLLAALRKVANIKIFTDTPFVIADISNWVKGSLSPDIMVFEQTRYDAYVAATPDYLDKPVVLIPHLCIEVISKNDDYKDVMAKVEKYMALGVRLVWVFDPYSRTVAVRTLGSQQLTILHDDDLLDGGDVVAGFSLRVSDVWAAK